MTDRHKDDSNDHYAFLSKPAVGDPAAGKLREINETGVEAVNQRRKRLNVERAGEEFERVFDGGITPDILNMAGQQQVLRQIEDQ